MKHLVATVAAAALLGGAAFAQTPDSRPSGDPPASERAPGTAASDVAPGHSRHAPTTDTGKHGGHQSDARQHDATRGAAAPRADEARRANRGSERSASAAQSYGYPASGTQGR